MGSTQTTDFTKADIARGKALFKEPCTFVKGVVSIDDLPKDGRPEIAFAGRSNVGKSSLINAVTGRTSLARVSVTPGRTRELNFFTLGKDRRTLPGRHAGLRLCAGVEGGGKGLDAADPRLSQGTPRAEARVPADRRAARHQGQRHGDHGAAG